MKYEIINTFKEILSEINWQEKSEDMIADARASGAHSLDNKVQKTSESDDFDEDKKDKKDKSDEFNDESLDDDDDENDYEEENTLDKLDLKDALDYTKLKRNINKFRSSHSIKDPEVNEELKTYFKRLSESEKKALYLFLYGLTQVTLLDVSGAEAHTPDSNGIKVSISSSDVQISQKEKSNDKSNDLSNVKSNEINKEKSASMKNTPIKIGS